MKIRYTVPSSQSRAAYSGNGSTTVFSVPYVFFDTSDLLVTRVNTTTLAETVLVLTADYTVTGGGGASGSLTALVAPASGTTLVIERSIPYTQEIDYQANDGFPADVNEEGLDRNTMLSQQTLRRARQTPKLPGTYDPESGDIALPLPAAGKTIAGNTGATGWENVDVFTGSVDLPTLLSAIANSELLEYDSGSAAWRNQSLATILGRILTTQGDLLRRGVSGVERLAIGAANRLLKSNGTTESWALADLTTDVTGVLPRANGGFIPADAENILGANVAMAATGTYYTGPSVTLGTGKWFVSGFITLQNTVGGDIVRVKMWDGASKLIGATRIHMVSISGTYYAQVSFSGFITDPAGAVRISASPVNRTDGAIAFNASGDSRDSAISAFRIA